MRPTRRDLEHLSGEQLDEAYRLLLATRPGLWCAEHCRIVDKDARDVRLEPNSTQRYLDRLVKQLREAKRPVRLIVLKARQMGVTTWGLSRMYARCCQRPGHTALLAAHKDAESANLFLRVRRFHRYDPEQLPTEYSSRRELVFSAPHGSQLRVSTASPELGRSGTVIDFHGSEVAYWTDPLATLTAVLACIPKPATNWDTTVILESTANGMGGEFYERYRQAAPAEPDSPWQTVPRGRGEDGFLAVFLPWHTCPEYRVRRVPAGFERTAEERELAERYGLDDAQLAWRRWVIAEELAGDVERFRQEYPSCDAEAFLVSGRAYFPGDRIQAMLAAPRPEIRVGWFPSSGEPRFLYGDDGPWRVVDMPRLGAVYAIGADVAEGLDPTESHRPEHTDRSVADVIDVGTRRIVAKFAARVHEDQFARQLVAAARFYHNALLGWETNGTCGGSLTAEIKRLGYSNVYFRRHYDRIADRWTEQVGWRTDRVTRAMMLGDLRRMIRDGDLDVWDADTLDELASFVVDAKGKAAAMPGKHDDEVMALAIAVQMAQAAAEGSRSGVPAQAVEIPHGPEPETVAERLAVIGAVDMAEDLEEDDE